MTELFKMAADLDKTLVRCRELAEMLDDKESIKRLAKVTAQIELRLQSMAKTVDAIEELRRCRRALRSEVDNAIGRSRVALFNARMSMNGHPFSPDQLREESRLCIEESDNPFTHDDNIEFKWRSSVLTYLADAVERAKHLGS